MPQAPSAPDATTAAPAVWHSPGQTLTSDRPDEVTGQAIRSMYFERGRGMGATSDAPQHKHHLFPYPTPKPLRSLLAWRPLDGEYAVGARTPSQATRARLGATGRKITDPSRQCGPVPERRVCAPDDHGRRASDGCLRGGRGRAGSRGEEAAEAEGEAKGGNKCPLRSGGRLRTRHVGAAPHYGCQCRVGRVGAATLPVMMRALWASSSRQWAGSRLCKRLWHCFLLLSPSVL